MAIISRTPPRAAKKKLHDAPISCAVQRSEIRVSRAALSTDCRFAPGANSVDSTTKPVALRTTSHVGASTGAGGSGAARLRLVWRIRKTAVFGHGDTAC